MILHLRQALLLVDLLLLGHVDWPRSCTLFLRLDAAVLVPDSGALVGLDRLAAHTFPHLTLVHHGVRVGPTLLKVEVLDVAGREALGLLRGEVHLLLHKVALLPGHGGTSLPSSPNLVAVIVDVPLGVAVLLGDSPALGHLLSVRDILGHSFAFLQLEVLVLLVTTTRSSSHGVGFAFHPSNGLALHLCDVLAHLLGLSLALQVRSDAVAAASLLLLEGDDVPERDVRAEVALQGGLAKGEDGENEGERNEDFKRCHDERRLGDSEVKLIE